MSLLVKCENVDVVNQLRQKIWNGAYEVFDGFKDNDLFLSSLRKAADVLRVTAGKLLP